MKRCPKCKKRGKFYKDHSKKDGLTSYCRCCHRIQQTKWNTKNPDRRKAIDKKSKLRFILAHPLRCVLTATRCASKKKNIPFNLTYQDLLPLPVVCPILGFPLNYKSKARGNFDKPTLDRKKPTLGYIKGNVFIVSWRANKLKSDGTAEELQKIAAYANS